MDELHGCFRADKKLRDDLCGHVVTAMTAGGSGMVAMMAGAAQLQSSSI